jgi:hypothetical protein
MDDDALDPEDRIRALGALRPSSVVLDAASVLTESLADPELRDALNREDRRTRAVARGRRAVVGGVIALAGLTVAVPAAAVTSWLARTGEFGDPSTGTEVDDTEWIDLAAPDAPEVVVDAYPSYLRLPDSVSQDDAINAVSRIFERMSDGIAQEGLMTQTYEFFAVCAWSGDWLAADERADASRRDRAADWLADPGNYPSIVEHDGGGVVDSITGPAEAGRAGDADAIEGLYRMGTCDRMLEGVTQ